MVTIYLDECFLADTLLIHLARFTHFVLYRIFDVSPFFGSCVCFIEMRAPMHRTDSLFSLFSNCKMQYFLGLFAKLRKATISFVMPVCPSVHMEQLGSRWKDFFMKFGYFFLNLLR